MADNVAITPGTGASIATDDVGGAHYQKVKLYDGTADSTAAIPGDATDGLLVNLGINNDVVVTGSVTANAGTNLNTSLLALEAGGNLAGASTSLAIMDDWDESDRCKVNVIAGQAGVQGGSGAVSVTTQRVVLATDVALPAGTNAIGKLAANSGVDIGDVDVTSVPTDPFGANADAASATGSISAKLRFIAATGIPVTSVPSHAVTNAGTFATQATTATASGDTTMQNAVSASGNGTSLNVTGYGMALLNITGTFTATVDFEASVDAGATWRSISGTQTGTVDIATQVSAVGIYRVMCAGVDLIRARVTWTSGTSITVVGRATNAPLPNKIVKLASSTNNIGDVDVLTLPNVTLAAGTNTNEVVGDAAHDAGASGNPLLMGGYAKAAAPTDVDADADVVRAWFLRNGAQATVITAAGALVGGDAANGLDVDVTRLPALVAGTANIGDVDVLTVPADPFGANADSASATGSISAKLRFIAATGIPITSISAGNNNIGDVDVASIAAGTNAIGNVGIIPRTTGGLTTYHLVSAGSTNATNIKASAGQLMGWYIYNSNASMRKLAFHNSASSPTAGASIFFTLPIPGGSAANVMLETGIAFSSGIAITTVTGLADNDNTAVAANDLIINLFYA